MVYASQQTMMSVPGEAFPVVSNVESDSSRDSFLEIFSRMNRSLQGQKESYRTDNRNAQPMQSNRADPGSNSAKNGSSRPVFRAVDNRDSKTEACDGGSEGNGCEANSPAEAVTDKAADAKTDKAADAELSGRTLPDKAEEGEPSAEVPVDCESFIAIMDQIIRMLRNTIMESTESEGISSNAPVMSGNLSVSGELKQQLEQMLNILTDAAEKAESTVVPESVRDFAGKLLQLLGDDSLEAFARDDVMISTGAAESPENLISRMLQEAENVKSNLEERVAALPVQTAEEVPAQTTEQQVPEENSKTDADIPADGGPLSGQTMKSLHTEGEKDASGLENRKAELSDTAAHPDRSGDSIEQPLTSPVQADNFQVTRNETSFTQSVKAQFNTKEVLSQIVEKAETLVHDDKSEMVLQLKPESLGKVTLKIIQERGEIVARFVAENEQVKSILESNMQMLKDSLQKSGVSVQSLEVSVGQQGRGRQNGQDSGQQQFFSKRLMPESSEKARIHPVYRYGGIPGITDGRASSIDLTA